MLTLVTGTPGASKTAFVVTKLDEVERKNKINIQRNKVAFEENKFLVEKFSDDFSYYEYEVGSGHELKVETQHLSSDYFDFLGQDFDDLRPDYYFQRSTQFNEIVERINEREGDQGFKMILPVRTIYTNIKALKIDFVRAAIYDWRDCPDGSIIVIDEVQLVAPYSNTKDKNNDIIQELTIHRHRGFDFYFITQMPSLLHPTVKDLIGVHYHITRPYGGTPKVYQWGSARAYPNTLVNKVNCENKFTFKPQARIFKLYKSTTINTHQRRFPKRVIVIGVFVLIAIIGFIYTVTRENSFYDSFTGKTKASEFSPAAAKTAPPSNPVQSCVDQFGWTLEQCKAAVFNKSTQSSTNTTPIDINRPSSPADSQEVYYDPNKPFDYNPINKTQASVYPNFSGCIKFDGRYYAYTQQGTKLDVEKSVCERLIEHGERPFNYFQVSSSNNSGYTNQHREDSQPDSGSFEQNNSVQIENNLNKMQNIHEET